MFGIEYMLLRMINWQRTSDLAQATKNRLAEFMNVLESFEMMKILTIQDIFTRKLRHLRILELSELSRAMVLKACLASLALASPALFNALVVTLDRVGWGHFGSGVSVFVVLSLAATLMAPMSLLILASTGQSRKQDAYARILKMLQSETRDEAPQVLGILSVSLFLVSCSKQCGRALQKCLASRRIFVLGVPVPQNHADHSSLTTATVLCSWACHTCPAFQ
jgi:hypothetical protein